MGVCLVHVDSLVGSPVNLDNYFELFFIPSATSEATGH